MATEKEQRIRRRQQEDAAIAAEEAALRTEGDEYGQSAPTDRLQFGYAPSIAAEAVAFHSLISAKKWRKERAANYRSAIIKSQKLAAKHFEPVETFFKLKRHWQQIAKLNQRGKSSVGSANADDAEDFLRQLAMQNIATAATNPPRLDGDFVPIGHGSAQKQHRVEKPAFL